MLFESQTATNVALSQFWKTKRHDKMKLEWIKPSNAVLAVHALQTEAGSVAEQNCSQKVKGKVKCLSSVIQNQRTDLWPNFYSKISGSLMQIAFLKADPWSHT